MGFRTRGGSLAPGGVVGDGRYRLLAQFGVDERGGAHLWRARDGQLKRDVALTVLVGDPADVEAARQGRRTLERAAHVAKFEHPNVARVLDVLTLGNGISSSEGILGIVVAEWTRGTDLVDVLTQQRVEPGDAVRMVRGLAEPVEAAHQSGLVLGIDHPQRLRLAQDGRLRLAFPGALPDTTLRDDVKALGAVLYLLLTGRWALPGGPPAIPSAPRNQAGALIPPHSLMSGVPPELSSVAVRTIADEGHGGVRTSSAVLRMLDQAARAEEHAHHPPENVDPDGGVWTTSKPVRDATRRRKLALGVSVVVIGAIVVLAWLGMMAISFFRDDPPSGPPVNLAEETSAQRESEPTDDRAGAGDDGGSGLGDPVEPSGVDVFNPEGEGDGVDEAPHAVDGDPSTVWDTDAYREQFPAFKSGVGLISEFDEPIELAAVRVVADSPGTELEIRVADSADPEPADTEVVASGTLDGERTEFRLSEPTSTRHVLVWITALSGEAPEYQSQLSELVFLPQK
ncbi:protein kinase family protein [Saccharomonospora iraqiensis]|uniref:protein kinase family protein n=1 Tax=Saccharomonospora iraqiensis TaxID=52698 RepID=UPI00022E079F|nr:protein kinase family protein [Saccharomonospora iraqiensis]